MGEWPAGAWGILLALITVTVVLLVRRPRHAVTWVLMAYSGTALLLVVGQEGLLLPVWLFMWAPLLLAFPDGVRTSLRRQAAFWFMVTALAVVGVLGYTDEGRMLEEEGPDGWLAVFLVLLAVAFTFIAAVALAQLARSWTRSAGLRRARLAVVLAGTVLMASFLVLAIVIIVADATAWLDLPPWMQQLNLEALVWRAGFVAILLPPIAVGISLLLEPPTRRSRWVDRLWPWLLTVASGLILGGTVWSLAVGWDVWYVTVDEGERTAGLAGAVSALVVAVIGFAAVRPGRPRVPSAGDRVASGLRDLAERLEAAPRPDEVPPLVARAVGQALDLRGTAVEVLTPDGSRRLAEWGDLSGRSVVRPLRHAGVDVGSLVLVPHRDGVPVDLAALDGIVPSVAAVAAAARLTRDLAAARDRVLQVREEERARLRADLHDELSPSLAGIRLTIAAATDRLSSRDADAARLLEQADSELGHAGSVVRNILDDLRPDSLTHQDLLTAVQTRAATFDRPGEFAVLVQADAPLPELDPSVETAVFRVASEAMSNAARHSHGSRAVVRLAAKDGGLVLTVSDDGIGVPTLPREGVGLGSMADRAAAVGGHLQVTAPAGGGTTVTGWFPSTARTEEAT